MLLLLFEGIGMKGITGITGIKEIKRKG